MHRAPERLVLGSGSRYRRELLSRLGIAFDVHAPEVDETPRAGEAVATMVERLTRAKAAAVVAAHPDAVVIASDQAGEFDGRPLGKPGTRVIRCPKSWTPGDR